VEQIKDAVQKTGCSTNISKREGNQTPRTKNTHTRVSTGGKNLIKKYINKLYIYSILLLVVNQNNIY
jgi:hypothetical protein